MNWKLIFYFCLGLNVGYWTDFGIKKLTRKLDMNRVVYGMAKITGSDTMYLLQVTTNNDNGIMAVLDLKTKTATIYPGVTMQGWILKSTNPPTITDL